MSLLKCPKCGEMFSDTYSTCPFCAEDEELYSGERPRVSRRVGGGRKKPGIGLPAIIIGVVLVLGLLTNAMLGSRLTALFGSSKSTAEEQTQVVPVELNQEKLNLRVGDSSTLTATGSDKITFSSSDEAVATVDANGTVRAISAGTAVITAQYDQQSAACHVTVSPAQSDDSADRTQEDTPEDTPEDTQPDTQEEPAAEYTLQSIYGTGGDISIGIGESVPMEVIGTDGEVVWSMDDSSVATVSGGTVTGVAAGSTTLQATVDGQTLTCTIRVG